MWAKRQKKIQIDNHRGQWMWAKRPTNFRSIATEDSGCGQRGQKIFNIIKIEGSQNQQGGQKWLRTINTEDRLKRTIVKGDRVAKKL
jgi:hypothetical protein